jgi:hypothetical protein
MTLNASLHERLKYWQRILRIQDWDVRLDLCGSDELGESYGDMREFREHRYAIVRILKPEALDPTDRWAKAFAGHQDLESILVHELLHIVFDGLVEDEHDNLRLEQTINA